MGRSSRSHRDKDDHDDDKSKDKKKKSKKASSSNDKKKHKKRSRDDNDKNRTKSDKKSKQRRRSQKESSSAPLQHNLTPLGDDVLGHAPDKLLDAGTDYFAYHEHLWVYLYRHEGRAFNDLTSDETHQAFAKFCRDYNAGQLPAVYYQETMPAHILEECQTTRHKWKFQISDAEDQNLRTLSMGIKSQTDYRNVANIATGVPQQRARIDPPGKLRRDSNEPESDAAFGGRHRSADDRYQDRVANQRLKQHVQTVHEELTGGRADYGRERQLEQRKQVADRTHGAARDRHEATELTDDAIFGADQETQGFQSALQREKQQASRRHEKQQQRFVELQQKEEERQQEMMKKLGLQPGQKITIQPRNDG